MGRRLRIGIDTGGTFTDVVALDGDGTLVTTKTPSTPADPAEGFADGGVEPEAPELFGLALGVPDGVPEGPPLGVALGSAAFRPASAARCWVVVATEEGVVALPVERTS